MAGRSTDWLGTLLFGVRYLQVAGVDIEPSASTVNLSSAFTAVYNPTNKAWDVGFAGGSVGDYIQPTGSGGTAGLRVGRFDIDALGPIPGSLTVGNDDGTGDALKIDGGTSIITSTYALTLAGSAALTVGGVTTLGTTVTGDAFVAGTLGTSGDTAIGGGLDVTGVVTLESALLVAPAAGNLRLSTDGTSLRYIIHGGSSLTVATSADLASYVPTTRTVTGTAGEITVNTVTSAVALSSNIALSIPATITGARTFSGTVTMSSALVLSAGLSAALPIGSGGLGFTTAAQGDLFYASAANTPGKLSVGAAGTVLVGGASVPSYTASPTVTSLTTTSLTVNSDPYFGASLWRASKSSADTLPSSVVNLSNFSSAVMVTSAARVCEIVFRNGANAIAASNTDYASWEIHVINTSNADVTVFTISTKVSGTGATGNIAAWQVLKWSGVIAGLPASYASSNYVMNYAMTKTGLGVTTAPWEIYVIFNP